jgi:hypothetical protein
MPRAAETAVSARRRAARGVSGPSDPPEAGEAMIRDLVATDPKVAVIMGSVLKVIRYWLPGLVVLAGVLAMVLGGSPEALEGGAAIVGAGASIWLINLLFRIGVTGDRERDEEDAARAYFDRTGHWPDEAPPRGAGPDVQAPAPSRRGETSAARPRPVHGGPARSRRPQG